MPNSNYITQGERYEAEVFLAAYDATAEPEIEIDGAPTVESVENGRGIVTFEANAIGEVTWGGLIKIEQVGIGTKTYEIPKTTFTVAPQSVVISPTKMNVLYRGVDNPLEIGVPGVDPSKLRVSGPGVKQTGRGEYMANVTQIKGKEIEINVSVAETNEEGQEQSRPAGKKTFRIKGLPQAVGTIYGQSTSIRSKSAVKNATIEASFEDFPFDLPLTVNKFEIAIPGYPPETVRGSNKIPSDVKIKIDKLRPGSTVTIRNIEAVGPGGLRVRKVGNISVDVQN
jgi:GldM C-terminal domain.